MELRRIEITRIVEDPEQPRRALDEDSLAGLADSIRQHGVLNPITVVPLEGVDGFRIVTGERRWRASQIAGLFDVPCLVREPDDLPNPESRATEQLIENVQREDLTPVDKAQAIKALKERLGATNKEVARRLGLSERTIGYLLDLLDLPASLGEQIVATGNRPADGSLTEKHGRFLRQLNDEPELQEKLAQKVKGEKLSGDDTGKLARALRQHPDKRDEILNSSFDELANVLDISGDTDGPAPFSKGRAFADIITRTLSPLGEVNVGAISAADLPAVETALESVKATVDALLAELRAAKRALML